MGEIRRGQKANTQINDYGGGGSQTLIMVGSCGRTFPWQFERCGGPCGTLCAQFLSISHSLSMPFEIRSTFWVLFGL